MADDDDFNPAAENRLAQVELEAEAVAYLVCQRALVHKSFNPASLS